MVDFDTVKAANFGTDTDRDNPQAVNAKRLAFRYVLFAHNLVGNPGGGSQGSGCSEVGGDDSIVTLGSFTQTTVDGVGHNRGTTNEQAGTFMHEFGHALGFRHGGLDPSNCKPNYRSVMSYTRQFSGSPISNRRLDYSRSLDPNTTGGVLDKNALLEKNKLGTDPSLGPIIRPDGVVLFPADQIVFGPNAWSLVTFPITVDGINWNRSFGQGGKTPTYQDTAVAANINAGATAGCDGSGDPLPGWARRLENILYRASAAIDFAGGGRTETPVELTKDQEAALFNGKDVDGNGIGDGVDCGGMLLPDPNPDGDHRLPLHAPHRHQAELPVPEDHRPGHRGQHDGRHLQREERLKGVERVDASHPDQSGEVPPHVQRGALQGLREAQQQGRRDVLDLRCGGPDIRPKRRNQGLEVSVPAWAGPEWQPLAGRHTLRRRGGVFHGQSGELRRSIVAELRNSGFQRQAGGDHSRIRQNRWRIELDDAPTRRKHHEM